MSAYQYYEFLALDRPLTGEQRTELRAISTRAEITATRFVNEYQRGDLKGDPRKMVERYFDAFLYLANWGTRQLMFRLPRDVLEAKTAAQYCYTDTASLIGTGSYLILNLSVDREPDDDWVEPGGQLAAMVQARSELGRRLRRPPTRSTSTSSLSGRKTRLRSGSGSLSCAPGTSASPACLTGSTRRACPADELEPPAGKVDLICRDLDEVMHETAAASHLVPVKRRR